MLSIVHGAMASRSYWADNVAGPGGRCATPVVVELWGHGRSPSPTDRRPATNGKAMSRSSSGCAVDAWSPAMVHVIGQSLGGRVGSCNYGLDPPRSGHRPGGDQFGSSAFSPPETLGFRAPGLRATRVSSTRSGLRGHGRQCATIGSTPVGPDGSPTRHQGAAEAARVRRARSPSASPPAWPSPPSRVPLGDPASRRCPDPDPADGRGRRGAASCRWSARARRIPGHRGGRAGRRPMPSTPRTPSGWNAAVVDFLRRHLP